MKAFLLSLFLAVLAGLAALAAAPAGDAINALGIDLLHQQPAGNTLFSPYSVQRVMAMAFSGADGRTREEMARVLHFPDDQSQVDASFQKLQAGFGAIMQRAAEEAKFFRQTGRTNEPLTLNLADRLFGQQGYDFRPEFLTLLEKTYEAPFEPLDFFQHPEAATEHINHWVAVQTRDRIQNLIPLQDSSTRLVLVNAIYLKAPWMQPFSPSATQTRDFRLAAGSTVGVPTMFQQHRFRFDQRDGCTAVALPYGYGAIQFLILLPDDPQGLAALEAKLTPTMLATFANLQERPVRLHLPKLKLEPPLMDLTSTFQELGMNTAFDLPPGSANFNRMAPRRALDYLCISKIYHKAFLKLDEQGTEAAAATAVVMIGSAPPRPVEPVEVNVDHPFLFAIQDTGSRTCLFLGRVADPR